MCSHIIKEKVDGYSTPVESVLARSVTTTKASYPLDRGACGEKVSAVTTEDRQAVRAVVCHRREGGGD